MDILLPSEQFPEKTKKHMSMLETRNELKEMLEYEQEELIKARDQYGMNSQQYQAQENRHNYLSGDYGYAIEMFEDKVYGKQGNLF